jgi:hypothetical protein
VKTATLDDCPMCLSIGSVHADRCQVCDAQLAPPPESGSGSPNGAVDLPPAASPGPMRFSDVLAELEAISAMTATPEDGRAVAAACRRAGAIVVALRSQFLDEILLPAHQRRS